MERKKHSNAVQSYTDPDGEEAEEREDGELLLNN